MLTSPTRPIIHSQQLLVNEIFYSVQGEGASIGLPAIFLRLQLCNLSCQWCDTRYTWDTTHPAYFEYEVLSLTDTIARISAYPCRRLVITGGEPLLHTAPLEALLAALDDDWQIEIETNGTLPATPAIRAHCQLNVSPKLPSAKNRARAIKPKILKLLATAPNAWFKFVVANPADFAAMLEVIEECQLPRERIIVMPEGQDSETLVRHALEIIGEVQAHGFRLLPRLHVMLWGNKRGV